VHKGPRRPVIHPRPLGQHQDETVRARGLNTMHNSGWQQNNAADFDRDILAVFKRDDPFTLDDIKNLVLHRMLVQPGALPRFETNKVTGDPLGLKERLAHEFLFGEFSKVHNFFVFDSFDQRHDSNSTPVRMTTGIL
jgi:hypothetical protein